MNRFFSVLSISFLVCAAIACILFSSSIRGEERQADMPEVFPLLSDIPERPEAMSKDVRVNEKRYRELVAELEAERSDLLEQLEKLRRAIVKGKE